tara:strand:- start:777 stop:1325 length:549 start_codon:yes stop_codon:yes gene_type:complete
MANTTNPLESATTHMWKAIQDLNPPQSDQLMAFKYRHGRDMAKWLLGCTDDEYEALTSFCIPFLREQKRYKRRIAPTTASTATPGPAVKKQRRAFKAPLPLLGTKKKPTESLAYLTIDRCKLWIANAHLFLANYHQSIDFIEEMAPPYKSPDVARKGWHWLRKNGGEEGLQFLKQFAATHFK